MASLWRRAMVYLGLVDDEEFYDDFDAGYDEQQPAPQRGLPPTAPPEPPYRSAEPHGSVRTVAPNEPALSTATLPPAQRPSVVRTMSQASAKVHVVEPVGFNDAQEVGDRLKVTQPVILNLQGLDRDLQRRLIDFSSGLTYALGGSMSRVHDEVFLLTPANVEISVEERKRLQARGLYAG